MSEQQLSAGQRYHRYISRVENAWSDPHSYLWSYSRHTLLLPIWILVHNVDWTGNRYACGICYVLCGIKAIKGLTEGVGCLLGLDLDPRTSWVGAIEGGSHNHWTFASAQEFCFCLQTSIKLQARLLQVWVVGSILVFHKSCAAAECVTVSLHRALVTLSRCHAVTLPVVTLCWSLTVAAPVTRPQLSQLQHRCHCLPAAGSGSTDGRSVTGARLRWCNQATRSPRPHWSASQPHWPLIGPDKSNSLHTCYRICANLCTFLMAHENKYQLYGRFYQQININQIRIKCHYSPNNGGNSDGYGNMYNVYYTYE